MPASRAAAGALGERYYFTGKPCVNGHVEKRKTTNGHCMQCDRDRTKVRRLDPVYRALLNKLNLKNTLKRLADPEKRKAIREREREAYRLNPTRAIKKSNADRIRNQREGVKARRRELQKIRYAEVLKHDPAHIAARNIRTLLWAKENKDRANAKTALRRAARRNALPSCLSDEDRLEMQLMYAVAQRVSLETGVPHEIDHIVPLTHASVCGLHVPANLQLLSETANRAKANKFNEVQAWQ